MDGLESWKFQWRLRMMHCVESYLVIRPSQGPTCVSVASDKGRQGQPHRGHDAQWDSPATTSGGLDNQWSPGSSFSGYEAEVTHDE